MNSTEKIRTMDFSLSHKLRFQFHRNFELELTMELTQDQRIWIIQKHSEVRNIEEIGDNGPLCFLDHPLVILRSGTWFESLKLQEVSKTFDKSSLKNAKLSR